MSKYLQSFLDLIKEALDKIGDEYYKVTTTYEPYGIIRERVFCYELYHQMRVIQEIEKFNDIQIHGEIDKRGHINFDNNARKNPDFIFHIPGTMEGNAIVVEVKGKLDRYYLNGICKDIDTLSKFTKKHFYKLGVLIIYNYTMGEFLKITDNKLKEAFTENHSSMDKIVVICKKDKHTPLECEKMIDVIDRMV